MSGQPVGLEGKTKSELHEGASVASQERHERLSYLDWLRVLAVLGVFYAHALSIFNIFYWHISDARLASLIVFGTEWGMALFFLLAGASAWFSLGKRSGRAFLKERFARLVIPFIAGVLLLSPPQGFLLDSSQSLYHGSFLAYYPYFFRHISLSLTPQVLAAYGFNLWFLAALFLFSLLSLPLLLVLRRAKGRSFIARLAALCQRPGGIFLFFLPLALIQVAQRATFPGYQGWTDFCLWLVFFITGYLLLADARFTRAIHQQGRLTLVITLISLLALLATMYGPQTIQLWQSRPSYSLLYVFDQLLLTLVAWSLLAFVLYFGMRFLDTRNRVIEYANEAILPFYILHHAMIVLFASLFMAWQVPSALNFLVVTTLSLAATLLMYEVFIRRIPLLRRVFGMREEKGGTK